MNKRRDNPAPAGEGSPANCSEPAPAAATAGVGAGPAATTVMEGGDQDGVGASQSSIFFEGATIGLDEDELAFGTVQPLPPAELAEAKNDFLRYATFAPLGSGGVGSVSSCYDPTLGRYVALKKLHHHLKEKVGERTRFIREARVLAQVEHPHIVPVHELGLASDGSPYFTMKRVRGNTLAEILQNLRAGNREVGKRYPLGYLLDTFMHVAQAVAFAHSRGIIHRDLKPSNVLIGEFGEVLVVDWGLAKVVGSTVEEGEGHPELSSQEQENLDRLGQTSMTLEGVISGTPAYMAPEQALGRVADLNGQTDVYSLGAILYEILTWRRMIDGDTVRAALQNVIHGSIIPPRKRAPERRISRDLEAICMKAVAHRPEDRYASVRDLLDDIHNYQNAFPVNARPDCPLNRSIKWIRRHQLASSIAITSFLVLLLATGTLGLNRHSRHRTLVEAADSYRREGDQHYLKMRQLHMQWVHQPARFDQGNPQSGLGDDLAGQLRELEGIVENRYQAARLTYAQAVGRRPPSTAIRKAVFAILDNQITYALLRRDYKRAQEHLAFLRHYLGNQFEQATADTRERLLAYDEIARGNTTLRVITHEPDATYTLLHYTPDEQGILGVAQAMPLLAGGDTELTLPRGSYLVAARSAAGNEFAFPIQFVDRDRQTLDIQLPAELVPGAVFVPAGDFLCGGLASRSGRQYVANLPAFFIKKTEVTFAEFLEFWLADDGGQRDDRLRGRVRFDPELPAFELAWDDHGRLRPEFEPEMPVVGITHLAAEQYCAWRGRQLGRVVRLPTAAEWEKAARGVDGREYPWGNGFDPNLSFTSENLEGKLRHPYFAPVGQFPLDRSVYGALDMGGNARERTGSRFADGSQFYQIKGSSGSLTRRFAACAYSSDTPVVPTDVGFRYVVEPSHQP